jgi:hypothetical protein
MKTILYTDDTHVLVYDNATAPERSGCQRAFLAGKIPQKYEHDGKMRETSPMYPVYTNKPTEDHGRVKGAGKPWFYPRGGFHPVSRSIMWRFT